MMRERERRRRRTVCGAFGLWRRYDSFLRPEAANCNQRIKRRGTALHYDRTIGKGWLAHNPGVWHGSASAAPRKKNKGKNGWKGRTEGQALKAAERKRKRKDKYKKGDRGGTEMSLRFLSRALFRTRLGRDRQALG